MKRFVIAVLAVGVVFSAGSSFAQEDASHMPEKVRAFLNNLVGTWNMVSPVKGMTKIKWDPGKNALSDICQLQGEISGSWSTLWHWDGESDDGITVNWVRTINKEVFVGNLRGKVLSKTLMKGEVVIVYNDKKFSSKALVDLKDTNQYIWKATDCLLDGEKQPDITFIYSRVKPTTRENFEEYCRLQEGRWVCDITWAADWPGIGKKGDTVTAYTQWTLSQDGNALVGNFNGGNGSDTRLVSYDSNSKQIKTMLVASSGYMENAIIYKNGEKWIVEGSGSEADSTPEKFRITLEFKDDNKTLLVKGTVWMGDKEIGIPGDVWRKVSK